MKVRKEFLYVLFAVLQVAVLYVFLYGAYTAGRLAEPTEVWWGQLGIGLLFFIGALTITAGIIFIGFVLYEWGKWTHRLTVRFEERVGNYIRTRQRIAERRREEEARERARVVMETENTRWEV